MPRSDSSRLPLLAAAGVAVVVVVVIAAVVGWRTIATGDAGHLPRGSYGWFAYVPQGTGPASGLDTPARSSPATRSAKPAKPSSSATRPAKAAKPLAGKVVVLDPGHQLGNAGHAAEINRLVDAGGFEKPCNTTGTATNSGYPEATFTWRVAQELRRILVRDGARVLMTRRRNSEAAWGPCVDVRGRVGNPGRPGPTADVKLSIHADGSYAAGAHGFHVIAPERRAGRTARIAAPSLRLARILRDRMVAGGFATSTYTGSRGIDVRGDLGTLNWSQRPAVMIECGNMRDARDAALLTSRRGQRRIARALAVGLERYLTR